ncbi:unnamed protein product [Strongylus vulgaris]|uniref:DUF7774 domain-containing protein n=1 Tax=Strongylus vulgaris TaxID=40348 RepID=A0A3P7IQ54_STRVU|nr:unnamed protein product [Strongylus vulgaris]
MMQLRRNSILEKAVKEKDLPAIKQFFKEDMKNPTQEIINIIDDAMNYCYEEVTNHQDLYDLAKPDMRQFLLDKEKTKQCMLDALLTNPEILPLTWGGEVALASGRLHCSLVVIHIIVPPPLQKDKSNEFLSPWNRLVEKVVDPQKV